MPPEPPQPDRVTVRDALATFYRVNEYGDDGGASKRWVKLALRPLPISIYFPNFEARRRALVLHDLHHLATGYGTDLVGEAEIAGWEIGGSCRGYWAAWLLNFMGFCYGWLLIPRRVFRAYVRGRHTRNLYRGRWDDALLDATLEDVRRQLGLNEQTARANLPDVMTYLCWLTAAAFTLLLAACVVAGIAFGFYQLFAR